MTGHKHYNPTVGTHPKRSATVGWEFARICIDDATRLVYVEVLANEKALTAVGFLRRAVAHFASYGVTHPAADHRQRQRLPLHRACDPLPQPRWATR